MSESLIDQLDDLPALMHLVQSAPASPRRFRGLVNNSLSMEETLQDVDHRKQQTKKPPSAYSKQSHKIIYEASRRIKKDSIPLQEKKKREISEIATLAKNGLMKKANSHDPVNLFRNFDECRNGYVTYEDFNQALLATNAGLSKNEISLLAQTLDQDHNGILDYTELTSSLTNLSKKYSLSIPTESSPKDVSSLQQTNTPPSPPPAVAVAVAVAPPVDPVDEGYQRAYEYGLRHLKETQEIQELFRRNEKKYYESLGPEIEIPYSERIFHLSSLQPPRLDQSNKSYGKGSGNIPITMVDHLDGVILPRSNKSEYFGKSSGNGDESDGSSYSDLYLKSQKEPINVAKSYNGRHITGAGPLSTSAVVDQKGAASGGPVRSYERAYIGNPTNPTNRSSRDFSNAFIVDQAKPNRRKKRPSSAPPTSRSNGNNSSLGNYLQQSSDSHSPSSERKNLPPFPAEQKNENYDDHTTHHHRRHNLEYDQTKSSGVITALQTVTPPTESYLDTSKDKKKRVHPLSTSSSSSHQRNSTSSLQMSLNTLLSQMNSYSKMKIFEHKMKQYDLSHSGYINKSEFISSLSRSGIHLTPEQAHVIFESHAQQPQYTQRSGNTSLKLSDHDIRAIPISEFMNKLQTRISTPALQNKFCKDHYRQNTSSSLSSSTPLVTPLQKNDLLNWKKLVNTLNSKQLDTKRSLELFKDIQVNHSNQIPPDAFLKELHSLGVPLNEIEYRNLISNVKRSQNGNIDMTDFTTQLHFYNDSFQKQDEMVALMPSLEHTPDTLSRHAEVMKRIEKQCKTSDEIASKRYIQQKKHFQQPTTTLTTPIPKGGGGTQEKNMNKKRNEYLEIFQQTSSFHPPHQHHGIPTCLLNGNSSDNKKERLRWSKMKDMIVNKRNDLLKVFSESSSPTSVTTDSTSPHHLQEAYTPSQIRDKFSQVGIQLGDEDYKLFHSYVLQNTSPVSSSSVKASKKEEVRGEENHNSLNFEQICDSIGVTVHTDTTRRARAVCKDDCQRDGGIFGSSEKSLLSHPTYRVNMLSSSLDDTPYGRGNKRRHHDPITGIALDPSATSQAKISTSEFWEFKHIPEMKAIPANILRGDSRGSSGYKYQGTSLREFQKQGPSRRSASAPPASRNPTGSDSKKYLWQKEQQQPQQQKGQQPITKPLSTRFASTPLAQYLKLKQGNLNNTTQQQHEPNSLLLHYAPDDHNVTPMRTSELNSSIASSISFPPEGAAVVGGGRGRSEYRRTSNVLTESHDFRGNEGSERETLRGW